jgi:hypothetical protein
MAVQFPSARYELATEFHGVKYIFVDHLYRTDKVGMGYVYTDLFRVQLADINQTKFASYHISVYMGDDGKLDRQDDIKLDILMGGDDRMEDCGVYKRMAEETFNKYERDYIVQPMKMNTLPAGFFTDDLV